MLGLVIGKDYVEIYEEDKKTEQSVSIVYWNLDEVEEDANIAISIAVAIDLFHTDQEKLLEILNVKFGFKD